MNAVNFGRLIEFDQIRALDEWPRSDDTFCLASSECVHSIPQDCFFVSHPWLTRDHPDPNSTKLNLLKTIYFRLGEMREEAFSLMPNSIDRRRQLELLKWRRQVPVMPIYHFNDWPDQVAGFKWTAQGEDASRLFLNWLRDSIDSVMWGLLWIDSFATPTKKHRAQCSHCESAFLQTLTKIPILISQTTCILLDKLANDETNRGWMLLETSVASASTNLIQLSGSWDARVARRRFESLEFVCSEKGDEPLIVRLYALNRIRLEVLLLPKRQPHVFLPIPFDRILSLTEGMLNLAPVVDGENALAALRRILRTLVSPEFMQECRQHGRLAPFSGRLMMYVATWCTWAALSSACLQREMKIRAEDFSTVTAVQACLQYFVCNKHLSAEVTAHSISCVWQAWFDVNLGEVEDTFEPVTDTVMAEIRSLYDELQAGQEFEIIVADFRSLRESFQENDRGPKR